MKTKLLLACWLFVSLMALPSLALVRAQEQPGAKAAGKPGLTIKVDAPAGKLEAPGGEAQPEAAKYIRLRRDDNQQPLAMETAIVRFASAARPGVVVDLIGAVHIADKGYYDELNKLFESYDVLLYELVAPEGTKIPKGGRKGGNAHPIGALQDGMGALLELQHQLACIDYSKDNFVHADMSPEEFSKTMTDRGESFMQMFLRMMGQGMAQSAAGGQNGGGDAALLFALFSKDRAQKLKVAMAEQFQNLEGQMSVLNDSTIISERNRKCFEVLDKQLKDGKKTIGVFYGAGHFPDMEQRLAKDFEFKRQSERWLTAWQLAKKKAEAAAVEPKKDEAAKP
jgi:hypothetical protein